MADTAFAAGATNKIVTVEAIVISTGLPYTAGAYNTSGLTVKYTRLGATPQTITQATATAGTYTSSGFVHRGQGTYEIGAPTAALATGADCVDFTVDGITDVLFRGCRVELLGADPRSARADADVKYWNGSAVTSPNTAGTPVVDVVRMDGTATATLTEPSAVPASNASLLTKLNFLATFFRNKQTQTSTAFKLRNDGDSADIGAATVSDDGTTFTRGKLS